MLIKRLIKMAWMSLMIITVSLFMTSCVLDSLFLDILNNPDLVESSDSSVDFSTNSSSVYSSFTNSNASTNSSSSSSDEFR